MPLGIFVRIYFVRHLAFDALDACLVQEYQHRSTLLHYWNVRKVRGFLGMDYRMDTTCRNSMAIETSLSLELSRYIRDHTMEYDYAGVWACPRCCSCE
jgi:hypothetical protein